jgi:Xaa-Pro aminopeptidase
MNKLQAITKGSQIIDEIFRESVEIIKTEDDLTEKGLAKFIRRRAKELGADGMAFVPTIVAFGAGSSEIHHWPTDQKIGRNNFLMLDYGVKVNGYCSDFTRTLFLGKPTKFHEQIYNTVLKAQLAAIRKVKPHVPGIDIDFVARKIIYMAGHSKHFRHRTGHGLGRKIHEAPGIGPDSKDRLAKGDVITVEPGVYLPGKFGVRIEDMILVDNKPQVLSKIPKDWKSMIIA